MDRTVTKQTIETEVLIGEASAQQPLRAEAMVSGAGRDAVEILMTDAAIAIKRVETQADRAIVEGELTCQAAYRVGDASSARGITARAPVSQTFEIKGAMPGMYARARAVAEDVNARYENGHMIFSVSSLIDARVTQLQPVELISDVLETDQIETKYADLTSVKLSAEAGARALLSESAALPASIDARCALMEWGEAEIGAVTPDVGGMRVTGQVNAEALIASGAPGRPVSLVKYALPFDQLIEMPDWLSGDVRATASVVSLNTEVEQAADGGDAVLRLEAEVDILAQAVGRDSARALTDAYAVSGDQIDIITRRVDVCQAQKQLCITESVKGTLMLPEGLNAAGSVCAVRARPVLSGFTASDGSTKIEGVIDMRVIYTTASGDTLTSVSDSVPFALTMAASLPEDTWITLTTSSAEGGALMSDRIEVKCLLTVCADVRQVDSMQCASEIVETGAKTERFPGVILSWPGEGDTLWDIGKKYKLPMGDVVKGNEGDSVPRPGRAILMRG